MHGSCSSSADMLHAVDHKATPDKAHWQTHGSIRQDEELIHVLVRDCPSSLSDCAFAALIKPVNSNDVASYIKEFDYNAQDAVAWASPNEPVAALPVKNHAEPGRSGLIILESRVGVGRPMFETHAMWHTEDAGHTWYEILCHLNVFEYGWLHWRVQRRATHLRKYLHDPIKVELGDCYKLHFEKTPFLHHGVPEGTTERMRAWLQTLAHCINERILSPRAVALMLRFFEAPTPNSFKPPSKPRVESIRPDVQATPCPLTSQAPRGVNLSREDEEDRDYVVDADCL